MIRNQTALLLGVSVLALAMSVASPAFAAGTTVNANSATTLDVGPGFDFFDNPSFNITTVTSSGGGGGDGVYSSKPIGANVTDGYFTNGGTIAGQAFGVDIAGDVDGPVTNASGGAISGVDNSAIRIEGNLNGAFTNSGSITGGDGDGVEILGTMTGDFGNGGTIAATYSPNVVHTTTDYFEADGALVQGDYAGNFTNSGNVTAVLKGAISAAPNTFVQASGLGVKTGNFSGNFTNSKTISGTNSATIVGADGQSVYA